MPFLLDQFPLNFAHNRPIRPAGFCHFAIVCRVTSTPSFLPHIRLTQPVQDIRKCRFPLCFDGSKPTMTAFEGTITIHEHPIMTLGSTGWVLTHSQVIKILLRTQSPRGVWGGKTGNEDRQTQRSDLQRTCKGDKGWHCIQRTGKRADANYLSEGQEQVRNL